MNASQLTARQRLVPALALILLAWPGAMVMDLYALLIYCLR